MRRLAAGLLLAALAGGCAGEAERSPEAYCRVLEDLAAGRVEVGSAERNELVGHVRSLEALMAVAPRTVEEDLEVVRDALAPLRGLVERGGNALVLEGPESLPLVTDPQKVRQCLTNLVGNAAKFTAGGTVTVRIRSAEQEVFVDVEDTGPGIAPDHLTGLFAPFAQAPAEAGVAEQQGAGLGLALTREFARARQRLPVVMDDVLVNFDDERAAAAAASLGRFARESTEQLLFFTCNERTRALLEPHAAELRALSE